MDTLPEQPVDPIASSDLRMDLLQALGRLSPELREAAVLFFLQGEPQAEIARILDIGLPLVKYRIRRAKELIKNSLEKEAVK